MTDQRKPRDSRFAQHVDYIRNTKLVPMPADLFDEDWSPIGPRVRRDMRAAGLIRYVQTWPVRTFVLTDQDPVPPSKAEREIYR